MANDDYAIIIFLDGGTKEFAKLEKYIDKIYLNEEIEDKIHKWKKLMEDKQKKQKEEQGKKDAPFLFKGFHLGMDIYEACEIINKLLNINMEQNSLYTGYSVVKSSFFERIINIGDYIHYEYKIVYKHKGEEKYLDNYCIAIADGDRRVLRFFFQPYMVNKLFNVSDLDFQEFAYQFAKAYGIPTTGWGTGKFRDNYGLAKLLTYEDKILGYLICISPRKHLGIEAIEKYKKPKERKFD